MNPIGHIWRSVWVVLLAAVVCTGAFALDPSRHISQYGHTAWRTQDGYFGGQAVSITQTTDGYIWVGTDAGLFRFDGVRFASWSSLTGERLPSSFIIALLAARDGSLWIATDAGLAHWVNQRLVKYLTGDSIDSVAEDETGKIWVMRFRVGDYSHPLCEVVDTAIRCYGSEDGVPPSAGGPLVQDTSGNLWAGSDTTLLRWRPGSAKVYRPKALQSNAGIDGVEAMALAADGSLWVGMGLTGRGAGLQHMVDGAMKSFVAPKLNGESLEVMALLEDHQKSLWVGTHQGIYRIRGTDVDHYQTMDGLSGELVQAFFEDREGNLWVATSKGIDMFHDLRVSSFSTHEGLSIDSADSVLASRDGTIWIGNAGHLEVLGPNGVSSQPGKALPGHQVTSLLEDHAGRLWVGIDNTLSIYQRGKFSQIKKQDGSPLGMIMGLTEDSENNIWVETHGPPAMLIRIQNLKVREEFPAPPMPLARKLVADPQSGIWLGLVNGDLARFRSGKTEIFPFSGHPDSRVLALTASSDGSILGATAFGVIGWKNGKQQILTVRNGLPCDSIDALISDNQGDLWLHAECGLIKIANDEVQRWWGQPESRLKVRVLDASDGVQSGVGHFNTSARTLDGRLWFANGTLLQMIDPAHMAGNTVAPPVHVDLIVADRKSYSPQEGLSLPPLTRDLEIDYTALSFVLPQKVFFRYMLDGRDTRWQEPGTRRQAFYNDLRPGHYRFRVIACNNDGVWNEVGATLEFNILPAFYQTKWFVLFCVAATTCLAWMAYRYRVRQVTGRLDMQFKERLSERTRIARELHDTLLQSFQGLTLHFQRARNLLPDRAAEAIQTLDKALDGAEQAIVEGRDAIHDLRSLAPAAQGLAEEITALGEELIAEDTNKEPAQFRVVIEGSVRVLHPNVHLDISRIAREALRNAFIHSQGRLIETEITYSDKLFRLRIRDDGKGLDPNVRDQGERTGHWGLRGMRERAERLGGELDLWSEPGAGTEVELRLPGSIVYEASPARNGVRLFWKKMKNDHERPS